jgi:hypothetical protein
MQSTGIRTDGHAVEAWLPSDARTAATAAAKPPVHGSP